MSDLDDDELEAARPRVRGDCARGPRPCPWISCRHHLAHVDRVADRVEINHHAIANALQGELAERRLEALADVVLAMRQTCALDVVARNPDGATLQEIGEVLDVTRERIRQIEAKAMRSLPRPLRVRLGHSVLAEEPEAGVDLPAGVDGDQ